MIEKEQQDKLRTQAYKRLFPTDDGKVLMEHLETLCNVHKTSVCLQSPNSLQTHYNEGKRAVYLSIKWYLDERYLKKEKENV